VSTSQAHKVRIIGGAFRGRVLRFPRGVAVRPTADRVRETLFNWLGQDLTGWATLDLFAGTGALTLEALSRGAALAVAVDRAPALTAALGDTARTFGAQGLEVHTGDARAFLSRETRRFDAIFLDPPYADDPWSWLLPACASRLAPAGLIYAEAGHALAPPAGLVVHRAGRAGQVHYHLLRPASLPTP
jgi:16S rRNA (guanine(966)-N(2))-methyltransferase RsmD